MLAEAAATLDLDQPTALMLVALVHLSADIDPTATAGLQQAADSANVDYGFHLRTKAEFTRFFDGLDLVEPGIVPVTAWHADTDFVAPFWSGVACPEYPDPV